MSEKKKNAQCETCAYYDYEDESDVRECMVNLDEDDVIHLTAGAKFDCPYYKFYDEYKFVQKQN